MFRHQMWEEEDSILVYYIDNELKILVGLILFVVRG